MTEASRTSHPEPLTYFPTIGIECHVQLKTNTKLFAAVGNDARGAVPNTLVSHICLGMPGALPVLNSEAVRLAVRAGFALGVPAQKFSQFERKHYFYPDLPSGYQITQLEHPIIKGGEVRIMVDGQDKVVRVHRVQLEADAGKSSHPNGADYSLVDLNRAGTPLLEIVSEPDIHSGAEAKAYVRELYLLMRYADVSDCDLYHGNMRFDVNVSLSSDPKVLGTRSETKNLNSFRSVEKAVDFEIARQTKLLQKGEQIVQETRGWDDAKQRTVSQRTKEDAHDYRYFPDPDLPPVILEDGYIKDIENTMPALPNTLRENFAELGLDNSAVETLVEQMPAGNLVSEALDSGVTIKLVKRVANWLVGDIQGMLAVDQMGWDNLELELGRFIELAQMTAEGKVSSTGAKAILLEMVKTGKPPMDIAKAQDILQESDESKISDTVAKVLSANPKAAADVANGEMKAIGFLVGQVMKESNGQANPAIAQELIKKHLNLSS